MHLLPTQVRGKIQGRLCISRPPTEKVFFAEANTKENEDEDKCGKSGKSKKGERGRVSAAERGWQS